MEKNTSLVLLPKKGKSPDTYARKMTAKEGPSQQVLNNILNYSRALKVEKRPKGNDFVEYIIN